MHPLYLWNAIVETSLFLFVCFVYFYLPGTWILSKLRLKLLTPEPIATPLVIGMVFFTLLTYVTSWVHAIPIALIPLLAIAWTAFNKTEWRHTIKRIHRAPLLIVSILSFLFSLPQTITGIWGNTFSYGGDDIPHLSYIHELQAHFPPDNPGFAGVPLKGYHFFADLLIANVNTLSRIPIESLFYHYFPILICLLIGFGVYSLLFIWTKRRSAGLWGVFLVMFGGSFGFILRLQGHSSASLASVFGIDQPASAILNWPFATSLALVTAALLLFYHYSRDKNANWLYPLALLVGMSPVFKVYGGIVLFTGFSFLCFIECIRNRYRVIPPFLFAVFLALITYEVFAGWGNYLIFFPLWVPHRVFTSNMPWYGYEEKHYTYTKLMVIHGIVEIEAYGLLLYIFGNLGTRLFGILVALGLWIKRRKLPSLFTCTVLVMALTALLIPLFFIQSTKVFEIIQLTWYYPYFCALFAAWGFSRLSDFPINKFFRGMLITSIILMTLPSTYEIFTKYVTVPRLRIPLSQFQLYEYLRSHTKYDDTVLEFPPITENTTQKALVAWYHSTFPVFPAFGNTRGFFETALIDFRNLDIDGRAAFLHDVIELSSPSGILATDASNLVALKAKLAGHGIHYIYSPYALPLLSGDTAIQEVYKEGPHRLYKIY